MATILQLKVAKRRLFEKVSLERCFVFLASVHNEVFLFPVKHKKDVCLFYTLLEIIEK